MAETKVRRVFLFFKEKCLFMYNFSFGFEDLAVLFFSFLRQNKTFQTNTIAFEILGSCRCFQMFMVIVIVAAVVLIVVEFRR